MSKFIQIHEPNATQPNPYDRWIALPNKAGAKVQGCSRSFLYQLIDQGVIRSANIRQPGKTTGRRLIWEASLVDYINRHAEGGEISQTMNATEG